jgi:hypothetical protein
MSLDSNKRTFIESTIDCWIHVPNIGQGSWIDVGIDTEKKRLAEGKLIEIAGVPIYTTLFKSSA